MEAVLVDTGVWYASFDSRDDKHRDSQQKLALLEQRTIVVPWPTMYETLRTKFVRNNHALEQFENFLKRKNRNIDYFADHDLQKFAFDLSFESSLRLHRPLSMVDCLIRLILEVDVRIRFLATFNETDFSDVCKRRRIEIL